MQHLKKIGAVGGAVVLLACWPLAVGQIAQNVLEDGVQSLNDKSISAEVISYDRSYFSAVAQTRYTIVDPALKEQFIQDGMPTEYVLQHDISHGFLNVTSVTTPVDFDQIPLTLNTETQLNGNTDFDLTVDAFSIEGAPNEAASETGTNLMVAKSSMTGSVTVLGDVDVELSIPSIQVNFETGETFNMTSMTGMAKGKNVNGFWHGKQEVQILEGALLGSSDEVMGSMKGFSYNSNSAKDDTEGSLNISSAMQADNFDVGEVHLANMDIDFFITNLDLASFDSLLASLQNGDAQNEQLFKQSAPMIDDLFSKGFKFGYEKINFELGEGKFESQLKFEIPEGTKNVSQDFTQLITVLKGKIHTSATDALLKPYPVIHENADELVVMEFAKHDGKGYVIDATIEQGNIVFANGQSVPLFTLFMSAMMSQQ